MIELSLAWPDSALSPNSHLHWRARQAARVLARESALIAALGMGEKLNPNAELRLMVTMYPPNRRRRDADNVLASLKVSIDSICKAVGVDDSQIKRIVLEWGNVVEGGKVELRLEAIT